MGGNSVNVSHTKVFLFYSTSDQLDAHMSFVVSITLVLPSDFNHDQVRDPLYRLSLKSSINPVLFRVIVSHFFIKSQDDWLEFLFLLVDHICVYLIQLRLHLVFLGLFLSLLGGSFFFWGLDELLFHYMLASKSLNVSSPQDEVQGRLLLNSVVLQSASFFKRLASEDESLLVWGDALLVLVFCLDGFDRVELFNLEGGDLSL